MSIIDSLQPEILQCFIGSDSFWPLSVFLTTSPSAALPPCDVIQHQWKSIGKHVSDFIRWHLPQCFTNQGSMRRSALCRCYDQHMLVAPYWLYDWMHTVGTDIHSLKMHNACYMDAYSDDFIFTMEFQCGLLCKLWKEFSSTLHHRLNGSLNSLAVCKSHKATISTQKLIL